MSVEATFKVKATTKWGEEIYLLGNLPCLGNWSEFNEKKMRPNNYPFWEITVIVPKQSKMQFKFLRKNNGNQLIYENFEGNRFYEVGWKPFAQIDCVFGERDDICERLCKLKIEFQEMVDKEMDGFEVFRNCWNLLSQLPSTHPYYCEPFYLSPVIKLILHEICGNIIILERIGTKKRTLSLGNGSSILINGTVGVGKTTLMKGSRNVILHLTNHILPLYCDFQKQSWILPFKQITNELECEEIEDSEKLFRTIWSKPCFIVYFADEIQELYIEDERRNLGRKIIMQLHTIGKSENDFGVASGSSKNTVSYAFKKDEFLTKFSNYQTLNHSVFRVRYLAPVRTREELNKIVQLRVKNKEIDLDKLFACSGGLGHSIVKELVEETDIWNNFREQITKVPIFKSVILLLVQKNSSGTFNQWKQNYVFRRELESIFERYNSANKLDFLLNGWLDCNFLYEHPDGIEFLIPSHYEKCKELFDVPSLVELIALEWMLTGWSGGHTIENMLRRKLPASIDNILDDVHLKSPEVIQLSTLNFPSLENLDGRLCYQATETGLDALLFQKDGNNFEVHVFQIKTGQETKKITLGGPKDEEKKNDTTMKGIIAKANVGITNLSEFFAERQEKATFKTFTLITTKKLNDEARKYVGAHSEKFAIKVMEQKDTLSTLVGLEILKQIGYSHLIK